MTEPQHFVLLGDSVHRRFFLDTEHWREAWKRCQLFWVVTKAARTGDRAFIYLNAPISAIVAEVELTGEPFINIGGMFKNPKMQNKRLCEVKIVNRYLDRTDLTMKNLRTLFGGDWRWLSYPRSHVRIPADILPPFLELIGHK